MVSDIDRDPQRCSCMHRPGVPRQGRIVVEGAAFAEAVLSVSRVPWVRSHCASVPQPQLER
jgi:hypothetical protein